jgi:hypothetical protein
MFSSTSSTVRRNSRLSKINEHTVFISESLAFRIYSNTKPHNLKLTDLQKGLIFVYNGKEKVGEGIGFGVPVIMSSGETYFSKSSNVYLSQQEDRTILCKEFLMDHVARNRFRNVRLENHGVRIVFKSLSELYQNHRRLRFPILTLKTLPLKLGVSTTFVKTASIGKVTFTYTINQGHILVNADFNSLKTRNLERIFILNEQGSRFFTKYSDSDGTQLTNEQIGAWDITEADWASITDAQDKVGFRLKKIENSLLRRGREFQKGILEWIGLDYEVDPGAVSADYEIEIIGA